MASEHRAAEGARGQVLSAQPADSLAGALREGHATRARLARLAVHEHADYQVMIWSSQGDEPRQV